MNIETLEKRIASCEVNLEKLEKSIEKAMKTKEREDKEAEQYYKKGYIDEERKERILRLNEERLDEELKRIDKEIKDVEQKLQKYLIQLDEEKIKEANRTVQVILDFLENWKKEAFDYYVKKLPKYKEEYEKVEEQKESIPGRDMESIRKRNRLSNEFKQKWSWLISYIIPGGFQLDETRLKRDLENDAKAKYDTLVGKIQDVVGTITDASGLYISNNGQINGIIKGEKGAARVETVDAGGYNIQRFHYRTLVHPV